jgi:Flp pilus assembly secretin CpaC
LKRFFLAFVFLIFISSFPLFPLKANPQETNIPANKISLVQGEQKVISLVSPLERVNIATKGVVNIFIKDPSSIVLRGQTPGSTKILLQYTNGDLNELDVVVTKSSPAELKNLLEQLKVKLAPVKGVNIDLTEDNIILSGEIEDKFEPYYQQIISADHNYVLRCNNRFNQGLFLR